MVLIIDEQKDELKLVQHTKEPKEGREINIWKFKDIDKFDSIPKDAEFKILLYTYDDLSGVKLGCKRYTNCQLLRKNIMEKTLSISCKIDKFYNNSQQHEIRADKLEGTYGL